MPGMPRTAKASVGDVRYHVVNRGNARADVFHTEEDFDAFMRLIEQKRLFLSEEEMIRQRLWDVGCL